MDRPWRDKPWKDPHPRDIDGVLLAPGDRVVATQLLTERWQGTVVETWPGKTCCSDVAIDGDCVRRIASWLWRKA